MPNTELKRSFVPFAKFDFFAHATRDVFSFLSLYMRSIVKREKRRERERILLEYISSENIREILARTVTFWCCFKKFYYFRSLTCKKKMCVFTKVITFVIRTICYRKFRFEHKDVSKIKLLLVWQLRCNLRKMFVASTWCCLISKFRLALCNYLLHNFISFWYIILLQTVIRYIFCKQYVYVCVYVCT